MKNIKRIPLILTLILCLCVMMSLSCVTTLATDGVQIPVSVKQVFDVKNTDRAVDTTREYTFKALTQSAPMPDGSEGDTLSFTLDGNATKDFSMSYTSAGIYEYTLTQTAKADEKGFTYDNESYVVRVYVKNVEGGGLDVMATYERSDGNKTAELLFTNSYSPAATEKDPKIMVDPPVKKTVSGKPDKAGTFEFALKAEDKANPMPEGSIDGVKTITIVGAGEKEFGIWSYTAAGTYKYTISEVDKGESGYTYDKGTYTITDTVTDDNGQLVLSRTITDGSNKQVTECSFVNQYKTSGGGITGVFTGDNTNIMLYVGALVGAVAIVVFVLIFGKKKKNEENK